MVDSDDNPKESFTKAAAQIRAARSYPVPAAPHITAVGPIATTILMIPWHDRQGALETLCFQAAERKHIAEAACVRELALCTGANYWPAQKHAKMLLRALVAATHRKEPDLSLGKIWDRAPCFIPIDDAAFNQVAEFLRHL